MNGVAERVVHDSFSLGDVAPDTWSIARARYHPLRASDWQSGGATTVVRFGSSLTPSSKPPRWILSRALE